jgi:ABC-type nitrate/sulfonate/bicarbonate transport system ATPase subunit
LLDQETADAGRISHPLNRAGYLPQGSLLFPWKRVIENLELPLQLRGQSRTERRARVRAHLPVFGLEGFESAYPHELSGGMQQRVALLRAVIAGARTLILDEPFGALDSVTRHRLQDWLVDLVDRLSCSMIFVTHDLEEAVALADKVLVLSERPASVIGELRLDLARGARADRMSADFLRARSNLVDRITSRQAA